MVRGINAPVPRVGGELDVEIQFDPCLYKDVSSGADGTLSGVDQNGETEQGTE